MSNKSIMVTDGTGLIGSARRNRELLLWMPRHNDLEFIVRISLSRESRLLENPTE
jgi:hypothetical protein